ncbi:unnamed protein product [Hyaloperonospora brassicae]|uniref:Uncharacterized protein n=1 Tax=Hyaloperonospora brassicae TaxID=162125 RepID=A0AAV0TJ64_HYABA|nr:unnamed protein product [Hyaloperonospora brassicae]
MKTAFSVALFALGTTLSAQWVYTTSGKAVRCEDDPQLSHARDRFGVSGNGFGGAVDTDDTSDDDPSSATGKYVRLLRCGSNSTSSSKDESTVSRPRRSLLSFSSLNTPSPSAASASSFSKVTRLSVRVQGDKPDWDAKHKRFVSSFYDKFDDKDRAALDTVNMASVEGALKYVQAECINASVVTNCTRKNGVKYVVFYQTTVVQPRAAMKHYANAMDEHDFALESCPFVPLDGGRCNPNAKGAFPKECNQYIGAAGEPKLGFCVGGTLQDNEAIAPYPHNYWFSFPNSCPQQLWDKKTDACRKKYPGGLCPLGVEPDGVTCTFSYEILGYILLDDVVGITSMVNPKTKRKFADYYEFCKAGGVEFSASLSSSRGGVKMHRGLEFWAKPGDRNANAARVKKLVSSYAAVVSKRPKTKEGGIMRPLPTISELLAKNPSCSANSSLCAKSEFGCKRSYFSQICQRCTSKDSNCEKKSKKSKKEKEEEKKRKKEKEEDKKRKKEKEEEKKRKEEERQEKEKKEERENEMKEKA